jgi:SpoVK/Ycf46/Vps4 family AAA+-type ATPase
MRIRGRNYCIAPEEYHTQIALWMLRIMVLTKSEPDDSLLDEAWFIKVTGGEIEVKPNLKVGEVRLVFEEILKKLEKKPTRRDGALYTNIDRLAKMVGLNAIDQKILAFIVLLQTQKCLKECVDLLDDLHLSAAKEVLADVLGCDRADMHNVLNEDSTLYSSGIIRLDRAGLGLRDMLCILDGMDNHLLEEGADIQTLFKEYFISSQPSSLTPADFNYIHEDFSVMQDLMAGAIKQGTKGINILIYGETGTGKTELAKVLATSLKVSLFSISHEDATSDLDEEQVRFRSYLLAQKVLARQRESAILFDEVEDVFSRYNSFTWKRQSGRLKAWTNAVLESTPCPAFWICNRIGDIDPAFLRRFTYVLHTRTPVRSVRRGMLVKYLGDLPVREDWINKISASEKLTPAMVAQACKIATLTGKTDPTALEQMIERALQGSMEAMGRPCEFKNPQLSSVMEYSLGFLNPSQSLVEVTEGLKQRLAARLCFYGPPGSGKTAFAHYISEQVDKPLIQKRASDILNCYVGGTEQNIAKMFREAKAENAILLLDEADSFLQDRKGAHRSWEITQVNELLVQMEAFEGIFICSTNLMDSLDEAVLRRFDLKIKFGFLTPDQIWKMLLLSLEGIGCPIEDEGLMKASQQRLQRLGNLTPGDFAVVVRKARVLGKSYSIEEVLAELETECKLKTGAKKQIEGFVR